MSAWQVVAGFLMVISLAFPAFAIARVGNAGIQPSLLAASIIVVVTVFRILGRKPEPWYAATADVILGIGLMIALATSFIPVFRNESELAWESFKGWMVLATGALVYIATRLACRNPRWLRTWAMVYILTATASALYGIWQWVRWVLNLAVPVYFQNNPAFALFAAAAAVKTVSARAFALMPEPSALAAYLLSALLLTPFVQDGLSNRLVRRALFGAIGVVLGVGAIFTFSQTLLLLPVVLVVGLLSPNGRRRAAGLLLLVSLALPAAQILGISFVRALGDRAAAVAVELWPSTHEGNAARIASLLTGWRIFLAHTPFGTGIGTASFYVPHYYPYAAAEMGSSEQKTAIDSLVVATLAEQGIPGVLLLLAFAAVVVLPMLSRNASALCCGFSLAYFLAFLYMAATWASMFIHYYWFLAGAAVSACNAPAPRGRSAT